MTNLVTVRIPCQCGFESIVTVRAEDVHLVSRDGRRVAGVHVQDAFPYLAAPERELFISGTCRKCWAAMFGAEDTSQEAPHV